MMMMVMIFSVGARAEAIAIQAVGGSYDVGQWGVTRSTMSERAIIMTECRRGGAEWGGGVWGWGEGYPLSGNATVDDCDGKFTPPPPP